MDVELKERNTSRDSEKREEIMEREKEKEQDE